MKSEQTFGSGAYDLASASHLLGIGERTLVRWAHATASGLPPLVEPGLGWAYTFHDLLSLGLVAVFHQRKISPTNIRRTHEYLKQSEGLARPFARRDVVERIQTVPGSVLIDDGIDASRGGQLVLLPTLERYLQPIDYGDDLLARLWRPHDRVLLDPLVQVGQPCVSGTRVTTEALADRHRQGEGLRLIADDLQVEVGDVRRAIEFERRLKHGQGLAKVA